jgi:hypothetical protein
LTRESFGQCGLRQFTNGQPNRIGIIAPLGAPPGILGNLNLASQPPEHGQFVSVKYIGGLGKD